MTVDCDSLLSNPLSSSVRAEVRLNRSTAKYENKSEKFRISNREYNKQYCETYSVRLDTIRKMIIPQAKKLHGEKIVVLPLSELREDTDAAREEDILIVGTLFKQQENKPSILKEFSEDQIDKPEPEKEKYTAETDSLVLEDETMRVKLIGKVTPSLLVNGVVVGCWGREASGGNFDVKELIYPLIPSSDTQGEEVSICILSGLNLNGTEGDWLESAQLAVDWICGSAGGLADQEIASRVERVILAGDCLAESTRNKEDLTRARYLTLNKQAGSVDAMRQLDDLLVQLAGSVNTDLLPGENDPATGILPQQPLHKCMFPQASVFPTFQSVTNPYSCSVGGREVLVLSGQSIGDIVKNSDLSNTIDILENLIKCGHVAPTCPDTLGCYPTYLEDPFVLQTLPDILVASNQAEYNFKKIVVNGKPILLLSVPQFSSSRAVVQISLHTLEPSIIEFESQLEISNSPEPNK
ncbi:DNA polymerase delta subunit 2 [Eurytemora carolleeae]|uniref:DNA polymerase delta subunit 2 n=1 Tax=Eurytemora carolleeae TaxID=1294199 RepID=UPI000C78E8FE|nr:DNA polymerase delta subunit 2 [Eurytemora carolleeae]|eukprot:XP_023338369.1 DNA polymerase delta subunit 2-like [Eurytemora affinis]